MATKQFTPVGKNYKNHTGEKFGKLTAIELFDRQGRTLRWLCRCDCGKVLPVRVAQLVTGQSQSCGCSRNTRGGVSDDPEYAAWKSMLHRCSRPHREYHRYAGRGITVCDRWKTYANFIADMGQRPTPKHSLDRIDNDGNYEPGNCRWATQQEQHANRTGLRWITHNGETLTLTGWALRLGISRTTLQSRLLKGWWSLDMALTLPKLTNSGHKPR